MKRFKTLPPIVTAGLLALTLALTLLAGWHRETVSRYRISDLPYVDKERIERQVQEGNVGRTEALYYRKDHAGADTTEIR